MICAECRKELEVGDQYIEGTPGEYMGGEEIDPVISGLMADIFSGNAALDGSAGGKIVYCEDCTVRGGDFLLNTYYGDEE